ncbi:hypothetical protein QAD02_004535 [Eretmocerus hayati]|uniref:Uncharacterized protein n=1 Tax=Eretmocerus hayati TaxID=131215 RepID=A0ACC2NR17_9HYME|nr:hypothetical protein QAD02_004535 [Eretmocerus hayati]
MMQSSSSVIELTPLLSLYRGFANALNFKRITHPIRNFYYHNIAYGNGISSSYEHREKPFERGIIAYTSTFVDFDQKVNDNRDACFKSSRLFLDIETGKYENEFLAVRQYNSPKAEISISFMITLAILIIVVFIFLIFSRIFKFNRRNWGLIHITRILLGASAEYRGPSRLSEMIFRICLFSVSGLITIYLNDNMTNILLGHQRFLRISTLKDLSESNLEVAIDSITKCWLGYDSNDDPDLKLILNRAQVYENDETLKKSLTNRARESNQAHLFITHRHGNGISGYRLSEVTSSAQSRDQNNGFVTVINKPTRRFRLIVIMKRTAFFLGQFHKYTMKMKESGIADYRMNRYAKPMSKDDGIQYQTANCYKCEVLEYDDVSSEIPLDTRLVSFLIIGYSLAGVVLVCEIILKNFGQNFRNRYPLVWTILFGMVNVNYPGNRSYLSYPRNLMIRGNDNGYLSHPTGNQLPVIKTSRGVISQTPTDYRHVHRAEKLPQEIGEKGSSLDV